MKQPPALRARRFFCLCALVLASGQAAAQDAVSACGPIANAYGPFDYRTHRHKLTIVEKYHFLPHIESLIRPAGASATDLGGNLDYTLRASPNHHRALIALTRYAEREKTTKIVGAEYSVDCYFDRALRFAPDDHLVRLIFAGYLGRQGRAELAERQIDAAASLASDNPFTLYNIGNAYFELKRYDKALAFDHRAKALGWTRKDLEGRLRKAGHWTDPVLVGASSPASAPASAAAATPASAATTATPTPEAPAGNPPGASGNTDPK